jgi:hypothetical protein
MTKKEKKMILKNQFIFQQISNESACFRELASKTSYTCNLQFGTLLHS